MWPFKLSQNVWAKPFGERAFVLEIQGEISVEKFQRIVVWKDLVLSKWNSQIETVIPAYTSLSIQFHKPPNSWKAILDECQEIIQHTAFENLKPPKVHKIPVCYEPEFAPDLLEISTLTSLSIQNIIEIHTKTEFFVFMMGFQPGFAYMGLLPESLHVPRKATPRTVVPAGSVAIAGPQTAIYPFNSPGGWNIIGRTPILPFDASRSPSFLFAPGDFVQFYAIDSATFQELNHA
jgi:inhibitor of KinA